jgi:hypothetical protein
VFGASKQSLRAVPAVTGSRKRRTGSTESPSHTHRSDSGNRNPGSAYARDCPALHLPALKWNEL